MGHFITGTMGNQASMEDGSSLSVPQDDLQGTHTFVYPAKDELYRKVYTGEWVDGKRHGKGTLEWRNGAVYQGQWDQDSLSGIGSFYLPASGVQYEGEFKDNQFHGSGVLTWRETGRQYSGNWSEGKHHGYGMLKYDNNDTRQRAYYKGEWVDGKREGFGIMKWRSGAQYEGQWVRGQRHGEGKQIFSNGDIHVGTWSGASRHGYGCRYMANGDKLIGTWKNYKKHGLFEHHYAHGRVEARLYVNGKLSPESITQEVPSLQVYCIEVIAKKRALADEAELYLPSDLVVSVKRRREHELSQSLVKRLLKNILANAYVLFQRYLDCIY